MDYEVARARMIRGQLIDRDITDERVLRVMGSIPRHLFVDQAFWPRAYSDHPLPIGHNQTISQPYMVALMTQELGLGEGSKVLEIGTGSGYQAAVLAMLGCRVYTVERYPELSNQAKKVLDDLQIGGIHFMIGDGSLGCPEFAPYDGIVVTAGAPVVPDNLIDQLAENGVIVIPVGSRHTQRLIKIVKGGKYVEKSEVCVCSFVPLVGEKAWEDE